MLCGIAKLLCEAKALRHYLRSMTWTRNKALMITCMLGKTYTRHGQPPLVLDLARFLRKHRFIPWRKVTGTCRNQGSSTYMLTSTASTPQNSTGTTPQARALSLPMHLPGKTPIDETSALRHLHPFSPSKAPDAATQPKTPGLCETKKKLLTTSIHPANCPRFLRHPPSGNFSQTGPPSRNAPASAAPWPAASAGPTPTRHKHHTTPHGTR